MRINNKTIQYPFSSADLITKIEYDASGKALYMGQAQPGSPSSSPLWQIKKFLYDASGNVTTITFDNSSNTYDKVWDNRGSYTYG